MTKRSSALSFFAGIAVLHLFGILAEIPFLQSFTKPWIVPSLLAYYWASTDTRSKPLLIALVFCWLGDVALMLVRSNENWFLAGLGLFLVGHIFFILSYRQLRWESSDTDMSLGMLLRFSVLLMMPGIVLVFLLYPTLGGMRVPVILYALAITAMVKFSFYRFQRTTSVSFWLVFCGSLIFMLSDSLIAIGKFMSPFANSAFLVMLTYIAAQFMIVEGLSRHR